MLAVETARLAEALEPFRTQLRLVYEDSVIALEPMGFAPFLNEVWRSEADQRRYFEAGTSKTLRGKHPLRLAADIYLRSMLLTGIHLHPWPTDVKGRELPWESDNSICEGYRVMVAFAEGRGLRCGARFASIFDPYHVEWPGRLPR